MSDISLTASHREAHDVDPLESAEAPDASILPIPGLSAFLRSVKSGEAASDDLQRVADALPVPLPEPCTSSFIPLRWRPRMPRFELLQQWEGCVVAVGADSFDATLRDLTRPSNPAERVELDIAELSRSDRLRLTPGAVFYWSIGYDTSVTGQTSRVSRIQIRRLPRWTGAEIQEARTEAVEMLRRLRSPE